MFIAATATGVSLPSRRCRAGVGGGRFSRARPRGAAIALPVYPKVFGPAQFLQQGEETFPDGVTCTGPDPAHRALQSGRTDQTFPVLGPKLGLSVGMHQTVLENGVIGVDTGCSIDQVGFFLNPVTDSARTRVVVGLGRESQHLEGHGDRKRTGTSEDPFKGQRIHQFGLMSWEW